MNTRFRAITAFAALTVTAAIITIGSRTTQADTTTGPDARFTTPTAPSQLPVLVYDVTGSTLAGLLHLRLSVYDSGQASMSSAGLSTFEPPEDGPCPNDGKAAFTFVGTEEIAALQTALKQAGAFQATNGGDASDLPLQTVTVFNKRSSHTFNFFFVNSPEIEQTLNVIHEFIDEHFPEF